MFPERFREQRRRKRERAPEKVREQGRASWKRNREKRLEEDRVRKGSEKGLDQRRERYRKNPEKFREKNHNLRARKKAARVGLVDLRRLSREMPVCAFHPNGGAECRGKLTVDHIFPLAAGNSNGAKVLEAMPGGPHAQWNLARSCKSSNSQHGNRFRPPAVFTGPEQEAYVRLLELIVGACLEDPRPAVRKWAERVIWRP